MPIHFARTQFAVAAIGILLSTSAFAQSTGQKANEVGEKTGVNSAVGITPTSDTFVTNAAMSDLFEIKSSLLAEKKADAPTQKFAAQMVKDHEKTTSELKTLLQTKAPKFVTPVALDKSHQEKLDKLSSLNGADFNKQYHDDQVSAHKDAVSMFERYAKDGDDPALKDWAGKTLPALQQHLDMAKSLDK